MLRLLYKTDLEQVFAIEEQTQLAPWTLETFVRCWDAGYRGWVLEVGSHVVGFILVSYQAQEAHILNLGVLPDHRRRGYAQKLMEQALSSAKAQEISTSFLEVRRSNTHAIALYEKLGYVLVGERKSYYPCATGREDALIFAKDLTVQ